MDTDLLLRVHTTLHSYIVRRDHVHELRLVFNQADLEHQDERGRSLLSCELGRLLDPDDLRSNVRRHALVVHLRRRRVALLAERVDAIRIGGGAEDSVQPLPPLLAQRLARPWFLGVFLDDELPLLVLDVRQIAQDVALSQKKQV